jgi:geranylgeranyl pyrophosphate synthase
MTDFIRRTALRRILAGALLSVSSVSLVEAAATKKSTSSTVSKKRATVARSGAKSTLRLKGGQSLQLTKKGKHWYAASPALANSRLKTPSLQLSNGQKLTFDRTGRLLNGSVSNRSFLEIIDD